MISERLFAQKYTTFWGELLPMGVSFVRQMNLQLECFESPLEGRGRIESRSVVNECGFLLFCALVVDGRVRDAPITNDIIQESISESMRDLKDVLEQQDMAGFELNQYEIAEACEIGERLRCFYGTKRKGIATKPRFTGCGILHGCFGDVMDGDTLDEVKSGDRQFKLVDLRQLLTYCALNYADKRYDINSVRLVNPRVGVCYSTRVKELVRQVSGLALVDFYTAILNFLARSGPST